LLVACAPQSVDSVLAIFRNEGFAEAAPIGRFLAGAPGIRVTA
jgi:selenide, water dikinase